MQDKIVVSSFWATVLVVGTLLSPIVTILINRGFDLIAKHLNNKHERFVEFNTRRRQLFEQYLQALADAARATTPEERKNLKLMDLYYMLLPYLPDNMAESFNKCTLAAANGENTVQSQADFQTVIIHIKELLDPQGRKLIYSKQDKKWIWKRPSKVLGYFHKLLSKLK
ncbi:hypothetical protein ACRPK0_09000 [Limosilactobacillus reuteri]|uniref:hypothetical protein n=1 Tax=Limosilactobacillus reuteri TaxID=1598 RepID=UPI003D781D70